MNPDNKMVRALSAPPRIAIPDGKGGYTYEELEVFDLRQPRGAPGLLPAVEGTRSGILPVPDGEPLRQPAPGEKK